MSHNCKDRNANAKNITNRILDDHPGDQRREDAAGGRNGVSESHEWASEVWTEVHMIDIVAAESGDVTGHGDYENGDGQLWLILPHVPQSDQRGRRQPVTECIADLPGHFRCHDVPPDAQIGYEADRKAAKPCRQVWQRRHHTVLCNQKYIALVDATLIEIE